MTGTMRVSGPSELIEVVPYLLGFAPAESAVIIGLAADRVTVVARVDLDAGEDATAAVMKQVLGHSDAAAVIVYTERPVPQWVSQPSASLREALLVSGGRWYSLLCSNPDCCPPEGRALAIGTSVVAATAVNLGLAPMSSREEIAATLRPGEITEDATAAAAQLTPTSARDQAWLALDAHAGDVAQLEQHASRYLSIAQHCRQDSTAAAPWFLYAWTQWRLGNGARAAIALDYLDAAAPGYSTADLLRAAVQMGIDPRRAPTLTLPTQDCGDELGDAVAAALDEAHLPWTRDEDSYTVAGCSVGLSYATGRPEVWQVERDADPDRVAEALARVQVAARGTTSQGGQS
jgi:hypothetical protein